MRPPIIINDSPNAEQSGDLRVYDSMAAAERAIEFDDATDDQLHVYDSEGRKLKIVPHADSYSRRGAHLEQAEEIPTHADTLLAILKDFLVRIGEPQEIVDRMDANSLMKAIYKRNPNPYSG